jgi:hypothetical protein
VFACDTPCTPQLLCDNLMGAHPSPDLHVWGAAVSYVDDVTCQYGLN